MVEEFSIEPPNEPYSIKSLLSRRNNHNSNVPLSFKTATTVVTAFMKLIQIFKLFLIKITKGVKGSRLEVTEELLTKPAVVSKQCLMILK